ncbi:MAG TPA: hypothetical protein VFX30_02520 [bacterium]|nr:hypothetical protein [bacterium]
MSDSMTAVSLSPSPTPPAPKAPPVGNLKIKTKQEAFRAYAEDFKTLESMKGEMSEADYGQAVYQLNRDYVTRLIELGETVNDKDLFYVSPETAEKYKAQQKAKSGFTASASDGQKLALVTGGKK